MFEQRCLVNKFLNDKGEHEPHRTARPGAGDRQGEESVDGVRTRLGAVPNLFRVLGTAPAALEGYLSFTGASRA